MSDFNKIHNSPVYGGVHNANESIHGTPESKWSTNGGSQSSIKTAFCVHHDHKPGWTIPGRATKLYGDAEKEMPAEANRDAQLIIDVSSGTPYEKTRSPLGRLVLPKGIEGDFEALSKYLRPAREVPRLQIPWPDFSAPDLAPGFWLALADLMPAGRVMVCCMGGHGRTGTALACLRIALWKESALEAAISVRRDYCKHAIETAGQLQYLNEVAEFYGTGATSTEAITPAVASFTPKRQSKKKKGKVRNLIDEAFEDNKYNSLMDD